MSPAKKSLNTLYLSLGSNLGNRESHLLLAKQQLCSMGLQLLAQSPIYQTEALTPDEVPQQCYLNQVLMMRTSKNRQAVLRRVQQIEQALGRARTRKWAPRTIDIDILLFNSQQMASETLTIPHRHLHERRFVLQPLADIAPDLKHPILKKTIAQLLLECKDTLAVNRYHEQESVTREG